MDKTRARARPRRDATPEKLRQRILRRINSLLQRTVRHGATQAEMEASLALAERLMLKHGLSRGDVREDGAFTRAPLTRPGVARPAPEDRWIAAILLHHFCVQPLRDEHGRFIVVGRPHELQLAGYVAATLQAAYRRLWREHCSNLRALQVAVGQPRPRADRYSFYAGLTTGLDSRLTKERQKAVAEDPSIATALVRSSQDVQRYVEQLTGGRTRRARPRKLDPRVFRHGVDASAGIHLNKPLPESGP